MSEGDPIDSLLDQAASYAKKRLDDEDFVDFNFKCADATSSADVLGGKHDLIEMREGGGQRGMHAKRDIKAGTNLVMSKPIAVFWDVEDSDDEDEDEDNDDLEGIVNACLASGDSGDDDSVYVNSDGEKVDMKAALKKFKDKVDAAKKAEEKGGEGSQKQKAANLKASESDQDNEDDSDDDVSIGEAMGTTRNGVLVLRCLDKIEKDPSLWTDTLSILFPRDADAALALPPWFCGDPTVGTEIEKRFDGLASLSLFPTDENEGTCGEIAARLPLIVRYNALSLETCSELFVYPDMKKGGMASLGGTGLYGPEVSYFNHSCAPNVSRYCIGDVMFFTTNRDVTKGDELCFSYVEHELLCESAEKRSALLDMDFELGDDADGDRPTKKQKVEKSASSKEKDEVHYPLLGPEVQGELMAAPATERLELINELLDQKADPVQDFKCDKYQLHILKAVTMDELGKHGQALPEWEATVDFAVKNFPPLDEMTIALRVQAALCALSCITDEKDRANAKRHANEALKMHDALFGGGSTRFRKRYDKEFSCRLRPIPEATASANVKELFG